MNILIISNLDRVWLLPAWLEFLKISKDSHTIEFILVPEKLGKLSKWQSYIWSFKTFGIKASSLLAFFSALKLVKFFFKTKEITGNAIKLQSFDQRIILSAIQQKKIEVVFVSCSYFIPSNLLASSGIPWVNKHSSLLPTCKGLFPFIWSVIHRYHLGISYHIVNEKIDSGEILLQYRVQESRSMVAFYKTVYQSLASDCLQVLDIISGKSDKVLGQYNGPDTYFSLPSRTDLRKFRALGGRIISIRDFKS